MASLEPGSEPSIAIASYAELVKRKGELVADDLVLALRDGRAAVRANAGLRDDAADVRMAAARALARLGE